MTFNVLTTLFCLLLLASLTHSRGNLKASKHSETKKGRTKPTKKNKSKKKNGGGDRDAGSTVMVVDEWRSGSYFYYPGTLRCHKGTAIGKVSVVDNFCLRFDFVMHNLRTRRNQWRSIIHIGNANYGPGMRQPGVWMWPRRDQMHFRFGDTASHNRGYDPGINFRARTKYQVRFCMFNGEGKLYINNRLRKRFQHIIPYSVYRAQIWVSDPWYTPADASISNIEVWSPTTHGETMRSKYRK